MLHRGAEQLQGIDVTCSFASLPGSPWKVTGTAGTEWKKTQAARHDAVFIGDETRAHHAEAGTSPILASSRANSSRRLIRLNQMVRRWMSVR